MSVLCAAALFAGCGKVNVGYVDQNRIQNEAPQIKASIEEMQGKMTEVQKEAEQKLQEASSSGASDEDMQKLQQQMQMKAAGVQQQYAIQIKAKVDAAMDDIVKAKKLDTVVNSNGKDGVVVSGGVDITEDVIQKLQ
ncbi:MAG: OmpH family outer membrane protein [Selenomonadaceae bacterium]|uniref:OmpH family outer membrane protein n=2 Tax=Anaerovibrio slackiae TaxID=2652309 RepID=A0A6I2UEN0_9FIRM|nr:OmpH family outer membrane protein [Selenomonadaceae bacterium]MSU08054.1 OmpH family outer membrane protein [Anaerovibrio slackiae]MBQ2410196.1 OmpH family outer membrane protein [Selenomonadaceae bacterium]MBQ5584803.1 OmpH family outer membrane protein [Selenomonadaceae bacterium]MBQ5731690.1 OmpH family outer membrane protein [Selenomonadaceae bacterium]